VDKINYLGRYEDILNEINYLGRYDYEDIRIIGPTYLFMYIHVDCRCYTVPVPIYIVQPR
jgi:hypothetical protein